MAEDDGAGASITVDGADVLSVAAASGYGAARPDFGGMTVGVALSRLFALVAPTLSVQVAEATVTLPTHYICGDRSVQEDWTAIAEAAGWEVRSDPMGVVTCGPPSAREAIVADWQEGPDCPAHDWHREIGGTIHNIFVVESTNPDADPIRVEVRHADPSSPTSVDNYGPSQRTITSDAITSVEAALNIGRLWAGKEQQGTETLALKIPSRPDLRYRDRVTARRDLVGAAGVYEVRAWTLHCPIEGVSPQAMEVSMMARTIR